MKRILSFFLLLLFFISHLNSQRVISLLPSYTEIIFDLGGGDNLVGVTNFCNKPERAKDIAKVGDYLNPDIEAIYRLKPDIIFIGEWKNDIIKRFAKKKNIKIVYIPQEKTVEDIYRTINIIAKHLNKEKEAKRIIERMRTDIKKAVKSRSFKKVYVEIDRNLWTCGKDSFISDIIAKSGGINIFNDVAKSYFQASWEEVIKRDPDVVLLMSGEPVEFFIKRQMADKISAVKNSKVFLLSENERDLLSRPTPSIVSVIEKLAWYLSDEKR